MDVVDLTQLKLEAVFDHLYGQTALKYLPLECFVSEVDFQTQKPLLYPFGELSYRGVSSAEPDSNYWVSSSGARIMLSEYGEVVFIDLLADEDEDDYWHEEDDSWSEDE